MATLKIFKVANNHNMENISLNLLFSLFHLKVTQLFCACPLFPPKHIFHRSHLSSYGANKTNLAAGEQD